MSWFTQIFWNVDIVATFFVGYYNHGKLVMDPHKIAKRYLSSWFVFDLMVVTLDWVLFIIGQGSESTAGIFRLGRSFRSLRFMRIFKLVE